MYLIYALICPITKEVKYIGRTRRSLMARLKSHLYCAKYQDKGPLYDWIRQLEMVSKIPEIALIEDTIDSKREKYWIQAYYLLTPGLLNSKSKISLKELPRNLIKLPELFSAIHNENYLSVSQRRTPRFGSRRSTPRFPSRGTPRFPVLKR